MQTDYKFKLYYDSKKDLSLLLIENRNAIKSIKRIKKGKCSIYDFIEESENDFNKNKFIISNSILIENLYLDSKNTKFKDVLKISNREINKELKYFILEIKLKNAINKIKDFLNFNL